MGEGPLSGARVLIAEDNFLVAELLVGVVRDAGGLVIGPAADASHACRLAATDRPTCALLDMELLKSDASLIAARLDADLVPFAIVTGYQRDWLPERLRRAPFLGKPVSECDLLEVLSTMNAAGARETNSHR